MTSYYQKFVQHYGMINKPLTELLKIDGFKWNPRAEPTFITLKKAMFMALVLALPDFFKPFTVETNVCDLGIGAVLVQQRQPLAFISQTFLKNTWT